MCANALKENLAMNQSPNRDTAAYCTNCPAGRYGTTKALLSRVRACARRAITAPREKPMWRTTTLPTRSKQDTLEPLELRQLRARVNVPLDTTAESAQQTLFVEHMARPNCRPRCGYTFITAKRKVYCPARSSTYTYVSPGNYVAGIGDPDHPLETRDQEKPCKPPNYCPGGGTKMTVILKTEKELLPCRQVRLDRRSEDQSCSGGSPQAFTALKGQIRMMRIAVAATRRILQNGSAPLGQGVRQKSATLRRLHRRIHLVPLRAP